MKDSALIGCRIFARLFAAYSGMVNVGGLIWFTSELAPITIVTAILLALCSFTVSLSPRKYLHKSVFFKRLIYSLCVVGMIILLATTIIAYQNSELVVSSVIEKVILFFSFAVIIHEMFTMSVEEPV